MNELTDLLTYTYGSATIPEIAWTVIASIGLVVSVMSIADAQKNLYYLQADHRPLNIYEYTVRETLAKSHLANELLRIGMHGVSVVIGVAALDTAPVNRQTPVTMLGYLIALGLITKATLNVIGSVKDRRVRSRMIALLVREDEARYTNGNGGR